METEAANAAVQTVGFIHPVMADVMTILAFVLVVASVGIAAMAMYYAWRQTGGTVDKIEGQVSWLRTEVERLAGALRESAAKSASAEEAAALKEQVAQMETRLQQIKEQAKQCEADIRDLLMRPAGGTPTLASELLSKPTFLPTSAQRSKSVSAPEPRPVPEPASVSVPELRSVPEPEERAEPDAISEDKPIWQDFLDDYHALREKFSPAYSEELCQPFVDQYKLRLLICSDHAAVENGKAVPQFEEVRELYGAPYWAYGIPGLSNNYAVVPSPMFPYDRIMHEQGGMKETFAARYEAGKSYDRLIVDMPAIFSLQQDKWHIEQPGLLKLLE